jgi:hypothetical protein
MALNHAQGYPRSDLRPDGGLEITDQLYGTDAEMDGMPQIGDGHPLSANCYLIKKSNLHPSEGGASAEAQMWYVDLLYGEDSPGFQYSVEQSPLQKPIEFATTNLCKTAYHWNWKYHLAAKHGVSAVPSWWDTAVVGTLISDTDAQSYRWIAHEAELPVDPTDRVPWYILKRRTKPGTDEFLMGNTVVKAQAWYANTENYETARDLWNIGAAYCAVPGDTCGLPNTARHWLVLPEMTAGRDGYYWTLIVKFMHSPQEWDADLYI